MKRRAAHWCVEWNTQFIGREERWGRVCHCPTPLLISHFEILHVALITSRNINQPPAGLYWQTVVRHIWKKCWPNQITLFWYIWEHFSEGQWPNWLSLSRVSMVASIFTTCAVSSWFAHVQCHGDSMHFHTLWARKVTLKKDKPFWRHIGKGKPIFLVSSFFIRSFWNTKVRYDGVRPVSVVKVRTKWDRDQHVHQARVNSWSWVKTEGRIAYVRSFDNSINRISWRCFFFHLLPVRWEYMHHLRRLFRKPSAAVHGMFVKQPITWRQILRPSRRWRRCVIAASTEQTGWCLGFSTSQLRSITQHMFMNLLRFTTSWKGRLTSSLQMRRMILTQTLPQMLRQCHPSEEELDLTGCITLTKLMDSKHIAQSCNLATAENHRLIFSMCFLIIWEVKQFESPRIFTMDPSNLARTEDPLGLAGRP